MIQEKKLLDQLVEAMKKLIKPKEESKEEEEGGD